MNYVFDEDLSMLIQIASNEDLDPLVEYIKKASFTESLTKSDEFRKFYPDHKKYSELIETEIKKFGGNSFLNLFRKSGVSYYSIVKDVADRLECKYQGEPPIEILEKEIVLSVAGSAWQKLDKAQKQQLIADLGFSKSFVKSLPASLPFAAVSAGIAVSGYAAHVLTITVANAISSQIIGKSLSYAANRVLERAVSVLAGPLAWCITGIWTILDLAGPAYRVTIPCVIHIALLRLQYLQEHCKKCQAPVTTNDKFCPNCGTKIDR